VIFCGITRGFLTFFGGAGRRVSLSELPAPEPGWQSSGTPSLLATQSPTPRLSRVSAPPPPAIVQGAPCDSWLGRFGGVWGLSVRPRISGKVLVRFSSLLFPLLRNLDLASCRAAPRSQQRREPHVIPFNVVAARFAVGASGAGTWVAVLGYTLAPCHPVPDASIGPSRHAAPLSQQRREPLVIPGLGVAAAFEVQSVRRWDQWRRPPLLPTPRLTCVAAPPASLQHRTRVVTTFGSVAGGAVGEFGVE